MAKLLDVALDVAPDDTRPQHGAWAPGKYMCKCYNCERTFFGDKRALSCAECAYNNGWRLIDSAPKDETRIFGCDGKRQFVMFWRGKDHEPHQDKPGWHTEWCHRVTPTHWRRLFDLPPLSA